MGDPRALVLTLAHPRARWSRRLTSWATTGAVDLQHQPCLTVAEVQRRMGDGAIRAVLADARLSQADSDLRAAADDAGVTLIRIGPDAGPAVDASPERRSTLLPDFGPDDLMEALPAFGPIRPTVATGPTATVRRPGQVVAVTGAGGTGVSTTAALLAIGRRPPGESVLLIDLSAGADQALRHGLADVVPGLDQAITDDRRLGRDLAECTHRCPGGFDLLPGPPSGQRVDRAAGPLHRLLDAAGAVYDETILDLAPSSLAGLASSPPGDARSQIDRVVVVARPDAAGLHRLCRILAELGDAAGRDRVIVLNKVTPHPRLSAPTIAGARRLLAAAGLDSGGPIIAGRHRRGLEGRLRDGRPPGRAGLRLCHAEPSGTT
jgi:MinD-like ATPase involved in chromosome partitioning or flagellar assembly